MYRFLVAIIALVVIGCGGSDFIGDPGEIDAGAADSKAETSDAGSEADAVKVETGQDSEAGDEPFEDAQPEAAAEAGEEAGEDAQPEASAEPQPEASTEPQPDVCVPGTCQSLGKNCGPTPDGCGGTISSCGSCPSNQSCGGGGVPNVCGGCVPDTCVAHEYTCGKMADGCGNTITCGPAYAPIPGIDSYCAGSGDGGPWHMWGCGASTKGAPPYPDCVKNSYGMGYYCCPEAQ